MSPDRGTLTVAACPPPESILLVSGRRQQAIGRGIRVVLTVDHRLGKPVKVVKLDGYKMIGVGEFALLGKYSHVEVMDAADFGQKYMATEPIAKAAATA